MYFALIAVSKIFMVSPQKMTLECRLFTTFKGLLRIITASTY